MAHSDDGGGYRPVRGAIGAARSTPYPTAAAGEVNSKGYPLNPGAQECAFYMKTGTCKFGATCRFDHPEGAGPELNAAGFPLNPGQPDCVFYMGTGSCKFGANCRFNHPEGIMEAGEADDTMSDENADSQALVDDGVEVNSSGYPLNPDQPDCAFFLRTGTCKFGTKCRFNHPEEGAVAAVDEGGDADAGGMNSSGYPLNPSSPDCAFYMKTGLCKFGAACRFNHPEHEAGVGVIVGAGTAKGSKGAKGNSKGGQQAIAGGGELNSAGFPLNPDQPDCAFFMKTGTCKFGGNCRFNHPDGVATGDASAGAAHAAAGIVIGSKVNLWQHGSAGSELNSAGYPLNPDQPDCAFYMKTGSCKFAEKCRFNHPEDGATASDAGAAAAWHSGGEGEGLNSEGYPLNPGQPDCAFFMKFGSCKFGANCKFNHPEGVVGEAIAAPTVVAGGAGAKSKGKGSHSEVNSSGYPLNPGQPDCAFYMKTGSCKFGAMCRFNHPEDADMAEASDDLMSELVGAIKPVGKVVGKAVGQGNGWSQQPSVGELNSSGYPLNPGQPDCAFFLKTGICKFAAACKFNHPEGVADDASAADPNSAGYPLNPDQPDCAFFMKTGVCKFGMSCKFNHPDGVSTSVAETVPPRQAKGVSKGKAATPALTAGALNSWGYPLNPNQPDCTFYMRNGVCKFAENCRFNHPEDVGGAAAGSAVAGGAGGGKGHRPEAGAGELNGMGYPLNPGQPDCAFFMKTGACKFGANCKFNHPEDIATVAAEESTAALGAGASSGAQLNSAGYPLHLGQADCAFYMKAGTCRFGAACVYNHPEGLATEEASDGSGGGAAGKGKGPGKGVGKGAQAAYNSAGYPLHPDQIDCAFYMRTGTCKFGENCRYNHPEGVEASADGSWGAMALANGEVDPEFVDAMKGFIAQAAEWWHKGGKAGKGVKGGKDVAKGGKVGAKGGKDGKAGKAGKGSVSAAASDIHPRRPGEATCVFFVRTGQCKFGAECKFDHPVNGVEEEATDGDAVGNTVDADDVELSSLGYPLRPGTVPCTYYMKTGTCRIGATCPHDHPESDPLEPEVTASLPTSAYISEVATDDNTMGETDLDEIAVGGGGTDLDAIGADDDDDMDADFDNPPVRPSSWT